MSQGNRKFLKGVIGFCLPLVITGVVWIIAAITIELVDRLYWIPLVLIQVALGAFAALRLIRSRIPKESKKYTFVSKGKDIKFLWGKITEDINRYDRSAANLFLGIKLAKYSTAILAGISTIILGLSITKFDFLGFSNYTDFSKNVALIIAAIITVISTLMAYWNTEEYWLTNKTLSLRLKKLRNAIEFDDTSGFYELDEKEELLMKKKGINIKSVRERFEEYQDIQNEFSKYWKEVLADANSGSED